MSINTVYDQPITLSMYKECIGVAGEDIILALMELERVTMQSKGITLISGLDMCSQLKHADLSHNSIFNIDPLVLEIIPTLETLNISHNKLTKNFDLSSLSREHGLRHLNISFNPITLMEINRLPPSLEIICVSEGQLSSIDKDEIRHFCPNIKEVVVIEGEGTGDVEPKNAIEEKIENDARLEDDIAVESVKFDSEHNAIMPVPQNKPGVAPGVKRNASQPTKPVPKVATKTAAKAPLADSHAGTSSHADKPAGAGKRGEKSSTQPGGQRQTQKASNASGASGKPADVLPAVAIIDDAVLKKERVTQDAMDELDRKLGSALDVVDEIDQAFLHMESLVETALEGSRKRELDLFEALSAERALQHASKPV